jgi:hypothetical protein
MADSPSPTEVGIGPGHCSAPTLGHTLLRRFPTFCDYTATLAGSSSHPNNGPTINCFFLLLSFGLNTELAAAARFPVLPLDEGLVSFGWWLRMGTR